MSIAYTATGWLVSKGMWNLSRMNSLKAVDPTLGMLAIRHDSEKREANSTLQRQDTDSPWMMMTAAETVKYTILFQNEGRN